MTFLLSLFCIAFVLQDSNHFSFVVMTPRIVQNLNIAIKRDKTFFKKKKVKWIACKIMTVLQNFRNIAFIL